MVVGTILLPGSGDGDRGAPRDRLRRRRDRGGAEEGRVVHRRIPHVDDLPVWSLWRVRVRPGHRGQGIAHHLAAGAVAFARAHGAPVLEAYPVDDGGAKVDLTMAYVGTEALFERAGFTQAAETTSVLVRLDLR